MSTAALHKNRKGTSWQPRHRRGASSLLNGDHLTVPEFERRYESELDGLRAELIEGIVVMSPPIGSDHGKANSLLDRLLGHYAASAPCLAAAVNASVRLDGINEYQPDVILWIESGTMARTRIGSKGLLEGRPELVVEIALSSRAYDLHEKKAVYQRNQIPEYLVWEVMDGRLHWFALKEGEYSLIKPRPNGISRSRIFPGLWLDLSALGVGDEKKVFRALNKGLKSLEYQAFVKKLKS
jgi:Uma2 family endonuclease